MSILDTVPTTTKYSFKKGDRHIGVWAIQSFLNGISYSNVTQDGDFGNQTDEAVRKYQNAVGAAVDGVVGPETQGRIVRSCVVRAPHGTFLPKGLVEGLIDGESGRLLAAVNAQVSGGIDCGLTQRRVYGPPFARADVANAFDPAANVAASVAGLYERYALYATRQPNREYCWRLAALAHNWPYAADLLSKGGTLSTTKAATWAPASAKFQDGHDVYTWREWAEFYALGSKEHNHAGLVTSMAFGVPAK